MVAATIGTAALGAVMGHQRAQQQEAQQRAARKRQEKSEKAKAKYGAWTGWGPDTGNISQEKSDPWGNMMQGMAAGAEFGTANFNSTPKKESTNTELSFTPSPQGPQTSMYGDDFTQYQAKRGR
jgi:hypothetical protein